VKAVSHARRSILAACALALAADPRAPAQSVSDPDAVLRKTIAFPTEYAARMTMTTEIPGSAPRQLVMQERYKEGAGSLVEVLAPARIKGMRFLEHQDILWMYNPRAGSERPVRLPERDSFQGSLFSNSDASDPRYTNDYRATISGRERVTHPDLGTVDALVLSCEAKRPSSPYGRLEIRVTADGFRPLSIAYYARSGLLLKRLAFSGYRELAGDLRPTKMVMESLEQKGARTEVTIDDLEERTDLADSLFTLTALTR
jgi:outer membrane lipoprotein-sorting protein